MDEAKARVYAAAAFAPLSILIALPIGGSISGLWRDGSWEVLPWIQAASFILAFAYPAMLLIGFPCYLILRRFKLDTAWTAMLVGYLTAASVGLLIRIGSLEFPLNASYWLNPFFFLGPVVGFVFWWVAKPRPEPQP